MRGGAALSDEAPVPARRQRPACGTIFSVMTDETEILAPGALAERERVLRVLHEEAPRLRARGITRLSLFGSMARGEAGPKSDIDLLIEIDPEARVGFFDLFDLQEELETRLGRSVQFAFGSAMRPWLREWIEDERIEIF
jgi:predicted nucleotidyltransferase